jgi:glucose-1-phosphate thymidylyltransferase
VRPGPIRSGGIIAAGEGSRLRPGGWSVPKPLVPVAGVPLIGHVLGNFAAAGIGRLTVIFNEQERDCADWLGEHFPSLEATVILKTTASSYESFREVAARLPAGRALLSTVDAWCPRGDFVDFADAAAQAPPETTVLALTPFVADEKPLRASLDAGGRVTRLGAADGDFVTAGIYVFPERVRKLSPPENVGRLREFLSWLVDSGEPVLGISIREVVDVDRPEDVALAEALAAVSPDSLSPAVGKL